MRLTGLSIRNMMPKEIQKDNQRQTEIRQLIVECAHLAFRQRGIKEVTMDDVSRTLRISKRTLYLFFADKEELVMACVLYDDRKERDFVENLERQQDNILDLIFLHMEHQLHELKDCNPKYFSDAYLYPRVREYMEQRSLQHVEEVLTRLYKGVEQGLFMPHIDFRLIVQAMIQQIQRVLLHEPHRNFSLEHCFLNIMLIVIRGCATAQGIARVDDFRQRYIEKRQLKTLLAPNHD